MSVIRKLSFWLIDCCPGHEENGCQSAIWLQASVTDCVREAFFFSFLLKWVWSYTEGVSKSIRVCSLSPAADSPQDYLTHRRDRNLPVSQWSHRAIVAFTSSPNISSVLPLDLKEAFQDRMSAKATPCPGEERWLWILRQMTLRGEKAPSLNSPVWLGIQTLCRTFRCDRSPRWVSHSLHTEWMVLLLIRLSTCWVQKGVWPYVGK